MIHGHVTAYQGGCRCAACKKANTAAMARLRKQRILRAHGLAPEPFARPDAAADHIDRLLAAGMPRQRIADQAGVSLSALTRAERRQGRLRTTTVRRILALPMPQAPDARGVMRRLRALAALGWSMAEIARRTGVNKRYLRNLSGNWWHLGNPSLAVRETVDACWRELHMTAGPNARIAAASRRKGWVPPLAWDDIDRDEGPVSVDIPRRPRHDDSCRICEEADWAAANGMTIIEVAVGLGMPRDRVATHVHRHLGLRHWTGRAS